MHSFTRKIMQNLWLYHWNVRELNEVSFIQAAVLWFEMQNRYHRQEATTQRNGKNRAILKQLLKTEWREIKLRDGSERTATTIGREPESNLTTVSCSHLQLSFKCNDNKTIVSMSRTDRVLAVFREKLTLVVERNIVLFLIVELVLVTPGLCQRKDFSCLYCWH